MEILIIKGDRINRLEARRANGTTVAFSMANKGPVPHDVVHLLVEQELRIEDGFWGLVSRGLDPNAIQEMAKAAGHPSAVRGRELPAHFVPIVQSERTVEAFEADLWGGGSDNEMLRAMVRAGCEQSLVPMPELGDTAVNAIRNRLAGFRDEWAQLPSGGSAGFTWPEAVAA